MSTITKKTQQTLFALISLTALLASHAAYAENSEYTSLNIDTKDCQQDRSKSYFSATCPSKADYKVEVEAGDIHTAVYLKYKQHEVNYLPSTPSDIGKVAEWRYRKTGGKKHYHAMIYRVFSVKIEEAVDNFSPRNLNKQALVVIRLDKEKSCIVNIVPQSKDMNERARKIADDIHSKCRD